MYVGYAKSVLPKQKLKSVGFQKEKWSIVLLSIFAFYFSGTRAISNSSFVVINQVGSFIKKDVETEDFSFRDFDNGDHPRG